jgi:hypothetical protein
MEYYQGEWFGDHHEWRVPAYAKDFLVFTVVRNPYERAVSGYFGIHWGEQEPCEELREQAPILEKATNPLTKSIQEYRSLKAAMPQAEADMNQKDFVGKSGASLLLYFERLPAALKELPFVDKETMPDFPHILERGIRPPGAFFDFFSEEDEAFYWADAAEEFEAFGYKRFECGLPAEVPNALCWT